MCSLNQLIYFLHQLFMSYYQHINVLKQYYTSLYQRKNWYYQYFIWYYQILFAQNKSNMVLSNLIIHWNDVETK